ncbi:olfactory receptor class A-like protein 4 [Polypterus senegalus]|nr:olfactory receptor class A-like protein 4 [Polypterus senegalus]
MPEVLPVQATLFGVLVFSGILGNILVIFTVFGSVHGAHSQQHLAPSDIILMNLSFANLLTSVFRTVPIFISDFGVEIYLSNSWCKIFMFCWVWWRSVGVWVTFTLSLYQYLTIRRKFQISGTLAKLAERRRVLLSLLVVWVLNFLYSVPALFYSTHITGNNTAELMVISCNTRPLLGCIWDFPIEKHGIIFATTSLAIHEVTPTVLMVATNLSTLCVLKKYMQSVAESGLTTHMHSERNASKLIVMLVTFFLLCWGTQILAVSYYNYNGGSQAEILLMLAQFSATIFVGFSPLVVMLGHSKMRNQVKKFFCHSCFRASAGK